MAGLLQEMRQIDEAMVYQQATPQRGTIMQSPKRSHHKSLCIRSSVRLVVALRV